MDPVGTNNIIRQNQNCNPCCKTISNVTIKGGLFMSLESGRACKRIWNDQVTFSKLQFWFVGLSCKDMKNDAYIIAIILPIWTFYIQMTYTRPESGICWLAPMLSMIMFSIFPYCPRKFFCLSNCVNSIRLAFISYSSKDLTGREESWS